MTPNEYQRLALRTENVDFLGITCRLLGVMPNQVALREVLESHINNSNLAKQNLRLLHSKLGIDDESGEIAKQLKGYLFYGRAFDKPNLVEEYGDAGWYIGEGLDAINCPLEDCYEANLAKLQDKARGRYKDAVFNEQQAQEENRDRDAEKQAMEETHATPFVEKDYVLAPKHETQIVSDGDRFVSEDVSTLQVKEVKEVRMDNGPKLTLGMKRVADMAANGDEKTQKRLRALAEELGVSVGNFDSYHLLALELQERMKARRGPESDPYMGVVFTRFGREYKVVARESEDSARYAHIPYMAQNIGSKPGQNLDVIHVSANEIDLGAHKLG